MTDPLFPRLSVMTTPDFHITVALVSLCADGLENIPILSPKSNNYPFVIIFFKKKAKNETLFFFGVEFFYSSNELMEKIFIALECSV